MVCDMPAVGTDREGDGYDVGSGRVVPSGSALGPRVVAAYRRAEEARRRHLDALLVAHEVPHVRIGASADIRAKLVDLSEAFSHVR